MSKIVSSFDQAVADIPDGATLMIDGFAGPGGTPQNLIRALRDHGASDLTIISNTAGLASVIGFGTIPGDRPIDIGILVENDQVKKVIASFPVSPSPSRPTAFETAYREGKIDLEVVPQGTLAERIRAGGAGLGGVFLPAGAGARFAEDRETRMLNGREHIFQPAIRADFALVRASVADSLGNLIYSGTGRNWGPIMAMSGRVTVAEVDEIREPGGIDPEVVITPAIFVQRIFRRPS